LFQIPIKDNVLEFLQEKFACCDNESEFRGMTNYENMMDYFSDIRRRAEKSSQNKNKSVFGGQGSAEHEFVVQLNQRKNKMKKSNKTVQYDVKYDSDSSVPSSFRTDRPTTFVDRDEAKLILDLEVVLESSPKFDLPMFQDCLVQKDNYGVGSVKRIHVIQAAENSKLVGIEGRGPILNRWLAACDARPPAAVEGSQRQSHVGGGGGGMYKIDKLVSYLDRSRPHVVDRIRKKVSSAAAVSIASGSEPSGWSSAKTGYNKIP
jgi:hypothetical protein